jgi:hypothetical protein
MAADRFSHQFISAIPSEALDCSADEFREMYTTYFGAASPAAVPLAHSPIPSVPPRQLDPHALELDSAHLPIATFAVPHDAIRDYLYDLCAGCGMAADWEPRFIFRSLIPPAVLLASGRPPAVVPDMSVAAPMPAIATTRGAIRGTSLPERVLLWDVKIVHGGTRQYYLSPRARDEQSGAVAARAHDVWPAYPRHAQELDGRFYPGGGTPIESRLLSYTPTRALVFGQYAEASPDVHDLVDVIAQRQAAARWRRYGARTQTEAYGFFVAALRRRIGVFVARELARHRLRRIAFVGVARAALTAYAQRGRAVRRPAERDAVQVASHEFFAFQYHSLGGLLAGA